MDTKNNKKLIVSVLIIVLVILAGVYFTYNRRPVAQNAPNTEERVDQTVPTAIQPSEEIAAPADTGEALTFKQEVLADIKAAAAKEDYVAFAANLKIVYDNHWQNEEAFARVESDLYKLADNKYYIAGNYEKMIEISTIVYEKVKVSWRFPYLRVLSFESLGRIAFEKGDLVVAEKMALEILKMNFRPEGAGLLADVYISRIKTNLKEGNTALAKQNLGYIWDFEVSDDRRATFNELKTQIEAL